MAAGPQRLLCPYATYLDRLGVRGIERLRVPIGQFNKIRGKPCHSIRMTLPYLMTVRAAYFIPGGMGRHFQNAPPVALRRGLTSPLTLSFSLTLSLGSPLFLSLSFFFRLPLCLALMSCVPLTLLFSLSLPITFLAGASNHRSNAQVCPSQDEQHCPSPDEQPYHETRPVLRVRFPPSPPFSLVQIE